MSKKKEAAGSRHSTTAKKNYSKAIIAEPIDIVKQEVIYGKRNKRTVQQSA